MTEPRPYGDAMQTCIDDAAGHVDRSRTIMLAFLANPTSLLDAVSVIGASLQQLERARGALAAAERIRYEVSPRRRAALRREASRNGHQT